MDAWRQWIRHRTANVNEYSTRYSVAIDAAQKTASSEWLLTPKFSVSCDNSFISFEPNGQSTVTGFGNVGFGAKYAPYKNAAHEFIVSSELHWEAPTRNANLGVDMFNVLTPEILYAKGFGDLPSHGAWK